MPTITLKDGDFGAGIEVTVGSDDLYLPDPDRPGLNMLVPLGEVVEIDALENDRSGQFSEAMSLAADGFRQNGPAGLIMGMYAASKVKDVVFSARLQDGRHFVAVTDAKTYAELHSAQVSARAAALIGGTPSPADDIIAAYLQPLEPQPARAAERTEVQPLPPPATRPPEPDSVPAEPPPTFGRRRGGPPR